MAIRNIRVMGDAVLEKECRPITEMNKKLELLIEDTPNLVTEAASRENSC